jgi:hypothetical protein
MGGGDEVGEIHPAAGLHVVDAADVDGFGNGPGRSRLNSLLNSPVKNLLPKLPLRREQNRQKSLRNSLLKSPLLKPSRSRKRNPLPWNARC